MDKSLDHTVLKKKFKELQETCRHADVAFPLSMVNVVDFVLVHISVLNAGDVFSNDALRRAPEESESQIKYDCLVA